GHAGELGLAVDLHRAAAAFAGLAVPAAGEIRRDLCLGLEDEVEDDHPRAGLDLVLREAPARRVAAPDLQGPTGHFHPPAARAWRWRSARGPAARRVAGPSRSPSARRRPCGSPGCT